jgi:hypothetical protein
MNRIAKAVLGTLMLAGAAVAVATPASAEWSVGFSVGPTWVPPPRHYYGAGTCNPYSRYYDPYYCDDYEYYYGPPLYFGGTWYDRPLRSRWYGGHREFWVHDRWYRHDGWDRGRFYRHYGDWGRGRGDWGRGRGDWNRGDRGHGDWGRGGRDHGGWGGHH